MKIEELISKAKALHAELKQAVADGEHIIETAKGDVETGQLVNAAGAAAALVANLENHVTAARAVVAAALPTKPAAPAAAKP